MMTCLLVVGSMALSMEPCPCCPAPTTVPENECHSAPLPPPDTCCAGTQCCDLAPIQSKNSDALIFTAGQHLFETLAAGAYLPSDKDSLPKDTKGLPPRLRLLLQAKVIPIYLKTLTILC